MNIDDNIPGWSSVDKLNELAKFASKVKDNGLIVEVGSFCGRSAYALGMNKKDNVELLCVDIFTPQWLSSVTPVKEYPGAETCYGDKEQIHAYETFEKNTADVTNMHTAKMLLPYDGHFFKFTKTIDLLFIDATHTYEAVKSDINQWCVHLADDGVVIFDDYFNLFPGCVKAVNEYATDNNKTITILDGSAAIVI